MEVQDELWQEVTHSTASYKTMNFTFVCCYLDNRNNAMDKSRSSELPSLASYDALELL